jgi:ABC-type Zn uptake system ZnuABC Zn-binding protein ZnuA
VGALYPGFSTLSEPSARDLSRVEDTMHALDIPAIFVGIATSPRLAEQVAGDVGVKIVPLYVGSLSGSEGPAPSYVSLLRYNVQAIVEALSYGQPR